MAPFRGAQVMFAPGVGSREILIVPRVETCMEPVEQ
jgi:hypothetical protein